MVKGWARLGWSGGGGSASGLLEGGNLRSDHGGRVSLTAGSSLLTLCERSFSASTIAAVPMDVNWPNAEGCGSLGADARFKVKCALP